MKPEEPKVTSFVTIHKPRFLRTTGRAWLIMFGDEGNRKSGWIPTRFIEFKDVDSIVIPAWLAEEKGW